MNSEQTNELSSNGLKAEIEPSFNEDVSKNMQPNLFDDDEILDVEQVCKLLKICKASVFNYTKTGILSYYKIGRKTRFRRSEILSSLKKIHRGLEL